MDRDMKAAVPETAFEPDGDNYLYYHNRRSFGIPVTAEERKAYISADSFAARRKCARLFRQRGATAPRRSAWKAEVRLRAATPLVLTISGFLFGGMGVRLGMGSAALWWRIVLTGGGAYLIASSGANLIARWQLGRDPPQGAEP